jgi:hypothetical protein
VRVGKQGKGEGADPALSGKVKEILQEVETAQAREATPEEILNRISSYVTAEPALVFPLIDALGEIPTAQTAQLLEEMMAMLRDKKAVKGIKRTLYRFKQRGLEWERTASPEQPILRPPHAGAPQGYVGAPDSTGSRVIVIARPRPQGGVRVYFSIVSDQEGIQRLEVTDLSQKGLKEFIAASLSSEEFPVVEALVGYCVYLMREAAGLSQRLNQPIPLGYKDAEPALRDVTWDDHTPLIYRHIHEESVKDNVRLLKESGELHKITPFSSWFLDPVEVRPYAEAMKEAEKSHLILTPQQKDARLSSLYREALEGFFPEEQRLLWKRRLEETAYILWKQGQVKEASMAVRAAIDLKTPFSPIDPNPFCWNLLLKSLYGLLETEQGEREHEEKSSFIVSP